MKKFAAIAAASMILISCLAVGASAKLLVSDTEYVYSGVGISRVYRETSSSSEYSDYVWNSVDIKSGDTVVASFSSCTFRVVLSNSPSYPPYGFIVNGMFFRMSDFGIASESDFLALKYDFYGSDSSFVFADGNSVAGSALTVDPVVPAFGTSIFSVGSNLLAFVTSSWITLVAVVAFVLVLCFGSMRRLIKGV